MKVFDCFLFHNEFEILQLKLETLYEHIDYFVIGESNKTFTGKDKLQYFKLNREKFSKYLDKIIYVEINDSPKPLVKSWCWNVEFYQRSALIRGLLNVASEEDIIIASDVDEIINPIILNYKIGSKERLSPELNLYYYYLNIKSSQKGLGPSLARYGTFRSIEELRLSVGKNTRIPNGGWHFTFMGGIEKITDKLGAYSESQTNKIELRNMDLIKYKIANRLDIFNRKGYTYHIIELNEFPKTIQKFCKENPQMVYWEGSFLKYKTKKYHKQYSSLNDDYSKRGFFLKLVKRIYKLYWIYLKNFKR